MIGFVEPTRIRTDSTSYNRYLAVCARVVRRSLKEQARLQAERRGEMDLKFAKWEVRKLAAAVGHNGRDSDVHIEK